MVCTSIVPFSSVRNHEKLPAGRPGSRGIQFQKKNGRLVLLVGNKCKYTDVVDEPSVQIYVSGEKNRKTKTGRTFTGGNRSLQLSVERQTPIVVWHKLGVNRWLHVGTFRLVRSEVRNDLGAEPVCWFTLRNIVGDFIGRSRTSQRLLSIRDNPRRSKRLEDKLA